MRRIALAHNLTLALWLLALPAAAGSFTDCTSPAFAKTLFLNPNFTFDCKEVLRQDVAVGGGVTVRVLRNAPTPEAYVLDYAKEAVAVIAKSFETWAPHAQTLGLSFANVTVVLSDPMGQDLNFAAQVKGLKPFEAWGDANAFTLPGECVIRINSPLAVTGTAEFLDLGLAHEAFHCVQEWSLPNARVQQGSDSDWWVEGTANFFAGMVYPDANALDAISAPFFATIRDKALTEQAYASVVFFAFLWQEGPGVMAAFLNGMPKQAGQQAQMMATANSVGQERMQKFAEALIDGTVAMPSGFTFKALEVAETITFDGDGQIPTSTRPFTVDAANLHFAGGDYVAPAPGFRARLQEGGAWAEMPSQVSPESCSDIVMLTAARWVNWTPAATFGIPVQVTRITECWDCNQLTEADQCLVGTWKLNTNDLLAYLQKTAVTMDELNWTRADGKVFLVLDKGGKGHWVLEGVDMAATYTPAELGWMEIGIDVQADGISSGAWSSDSSGTLHFCAEDVQMEFTSRVTIPGMDVDEVTDTAPLEDYNLGYSCNPTGLLLVYNGPAALEVPPYWNFERVK